MAKVDLDDDAKGGQVRGLSNPDLNVLKCYKISIGNLHIKSQRVYLAPPYMQ